MAKEHEVSAESGPAPLEPLQELKISGPDSKGDLVISNSCNVELESQKTRLKSIKVQRRNCYDTINKLRDEGLAILNEIELIPTNLKLIFDNFCEIIEQDIEIEDLDYGLQVFFPSRDDDLMDSEEEFLIKFLSVIYEGLEFTENEQHSVCHYYSYKYDEMKIPIPTDLPII